MNQQKLALLQSRAALLAQTRQFFLQKNVLEVSTSVISQAAITDPAIESFTLSVDAEDCTPRYLRTSPEFAMKRLLSAGAPDIYELGPVFRHGEQGRNHNPEFTLLEWYRRGYTMQQLIDEVTEYIRHVCSNRHPQMRVQQLTYQQAFDDFLAIDITTVSVAELRQKAHSFGAAPDAELDKDQWLNYLFATRVQPQMDAMDILVLTHYPASQAALAQLDPANHDYALRFEVFVRGKEMANGFEELRDATEQRQRFEADNQQRVLRGQPRRPIDEHFLRALTDGLPACSGVALGIDRLLMFVQDVDDIALTFAWPWDLA